jgi:hypothetical protein
VCNKRGGVCNRQRGEKEGGEGVQQRERGEGVQQRGGEGVQ